jgi:hypothetical protein
MGYTTDFTGHLTFEKPLSQAHADYLRAFNKTRRMKRDEKKAEALADPLRLAAGLPIGSEGAYYVGSVNDGQFGQREDGSILDHNNAPGSPSTSGGEFSKKWDELQKSIEEGKCQPGLWCQWTITDDNTKLEWDGGEKFYNYIEWLKYLIAHFIEKWGYKLNGEITWEGEDGVSDSGIILVTDNYVEVKKAKITYE